MKHFLKGRLELAKYLASDVPIASYADVVLIITAVLSACASLRWAGTGIDKKRFVELLVVSSPADLHTSWVSIPALINGGFLSESDTPWGRPGDSDRVFCDHEIDLSIGETQRKYPGVEGRQLRRHCYASLIYDWLRCGYAHEYGPHENITHVPPSRSNARVSYIGSFEIDRAGRITKLKRMVSFHLDYLFSIADHHVSILPSTESERPSKWWIDEQ